MKIKGLEDKRGQGTRQSAQNGKMVLSIYVDVEMVNDLARIAAEEDVKKADLYRYIFKTFIEDYDKK